MSMTPVRQGWRRLQAGATQALGTLRHWFDPPIESDAKPLEIRAAILDAVERQTRAAGQDRRELPHNHVSVTLLAGDDGDRAALDATLGDMTAGVRARLAELRCAVPPGFTVHTSLTMSAPAGWAPGQRLAIAFSTRAANGSPPAAAAGPMPLRITVTRGSAAQASYLLALPLVRIGRSPMPTDDRGQPRINNVVFLEAGDQHAATVGRAHASIHFDAARREYRLFDDGSHNGTRVTRGTATLAVPARNPVGLRLMTGDEIQLGTAAVTIEIDVPAESEQA